MAFRDVRVHVPVLAAEHHPDPGGGVPLGEHLVVRRVALDQQHPADAIGSVEIAAVNQEVGEDDDVALLGPDWGGAGEGVPLLVDMVISGLGCCIA